MQDQAKAYLYALCTVLIWSTVATAFKLSLRSLSVVQLLFVSCVVSVAVLFCVVALQGRLGGLRALTGKDLILSAVLGLLNPFGYYLVLFTAYDLLPAQEAQPLNYTWAITLSLLSVPLLGHRLRAFDLAGLLISYAGVYTISTRGALLEVTFSNPAGVLLALGSTIIWALYWIYTTKDRLDASTRLLLNFAFGALYIGLVLWLSGEPLPWGWPGLLGGAYVGVFEMGVTFVLWSLALKLTDSAAKVSILIYLSPFLSLCFIRIFVGEIILPSTIAGLALIVAGIGLQQWGRMRPAQA
jgi:drug/metabolite transporter (DMT)-like permease